MKRVILFLMLTVTARFVATAQTINFNVNVTNVNGCGGTTASAAVTNVSGGTSPYVYSDDGGTTYQGGYLFVYLTTGSYTIVVKDANGYVGTKTITIGTNAPITFTYDIVPCTNCATYNGKITIHATGGAGMYNFSKTNGSSWQSSNIFNYCPSGNYSLVVKDPLGCKTTAVLVTVPCQ